MSRSDLQWYAVINRKGEQCGKLKTSNPADNYATRMGMKLVPITDWKSLGYNTAADYARAAMIPLNPRATDEKTVAARKWLAPIKPAKPQQPCDIGLFSDDANQLDLCEMFMEPTNDDG